MVERFSGMEVPEDQLSIRADGGSEYPVGALHDAMQAHVVAPEHVSRHAATCGLGDDRADLMCVASTVGVLCEPGDGGGRIVGERRASLHEYEMVALVGQLG